MLLTGNLISGWNASQLMKQEINPAFYPCPAGSLLDMFPPCGKCHCSWKFAHQSKHLDHARREKILVFCQLSRCCKTSHISAETDFFRRLPIYLALLLHRQEHLLKILLSIRGFANLPLRMWAVDRDLHLTELNIWNLQMLEKWMQASCLQRAGLVTCDKPKDFSAFPQNLKSR